MKQIFYAYIIECSDGSYYTGYTHDLKRRLRQHNGKIKWNVSKYTRVRRPVTLQHFETFKTRNEAMKREHEIKQLKRIEKEVLCANGNKIGY